MDHYFGWVGVGGSLFWVDGTEWGWGGALFDSAIFFLAPKDKGF